MTQKNQEVIVKKQTFEEIYPTREDWRLVSFSKRKKNKTFFLYQRLLFLQY